MRILRWSRWPLWAVFTLLILAALACGFSVSTAKLDNIKLYKDPDRQTKTTSYTTGDTFYCILDLKNAPDDTTVKAVWYAVAGAETPTDTKIGEYELTNGSGVLTFSVKPPDNGWPKGDYKVELYLNGKKKETLTFKVK